MNSFAQLKQDPQSRAVANTFSRREQHWAAPGSQLKHFAALQEMVNSRPQVRQVAQMQQGLNERPCAAATLQRKENQTGMPDRLKNGIERLANLSMHDVKVEYNSPKPAQFQANAITQGKDIHVGPGQEHHLAHEAWHVVQQKQGRVQATTQMQGTAINDDSELEREADVMGERASNLTDSSSGQVNPAAATRVSASEPVGQRLKKAVTSAFARPSRSVIQMNGDKESSFQNFFKRHIYGEHSYDLSHQVHTRSPGVTDEEATKKTFEIIKKHPAPLSLGRESTEEGGTMWIPPFGQINTMTNPLQNYLTNVTMPRRHVLHPGWVKRSAVGENVRTEGGGTGLFPSLNEGAANMLWGSMAYRDRLRNDPKFATRHYADVLKHTEEAMANY